MQNVVYFSPFSNISVVIPAAALKTYQERDATLIKIRELVSVSASNNYSQLIKLRARLSAAKRKIERESWYNTPSQR